MDVPAYFRFDEVENVRCTIEICAELAQKIEERPTYLKWLIIAVHDILQSAMVWALSGSDGAGALEKKSRKAMRDWLLERRKNPEIPCPNPEGLYLADFKELLKRAQKDSRSGYGVVLPPKLAPKEEKDLHYLHDLRNMFVHFRVMDWSIESDGFAACSHRCP